MSKYNPLWEYVQKNGSQSFKLTFEEKEKVYNGIRYTPMEMKLFVHEIDL